MSDFNRTKIGKISDTIKSLSKKKMATHTDTVRTNFGAPLCRFHFREDGAFVERTTADLFGKKRVVLFGLPGAFTPTCSNSQVPDYEAAYDDLIAAGVDEVYCISVNDAFVMNAWRESLGIKKVKFIPDGNAFFTRQILANVFKGDVGFGTRSWRYAAVINFEEVEIMYTEPGMMDNCKEDPYEMSRPAKILEYLRQTPRVDPRENGKDELDVLQALETELYLKKNS